MIFVSTTKKSAFETYLIYLLAQKKNIPNTFPGTESRLGGSSCRIFLAIRKKRVTCLLDRIIIFASRRVSRRHVLLSIRVG